jgi:hypothetical protein
LIIKDKQDSIVEKKLIHIIDYNDEKINPLFDTDLIFKGSAKWKNNIFSLFSPKGELLGSISLELFLLQSTKAKPEQIYNTKEVILILHEPEKDYGKGE